MANKERSIFTEAVHAGERPGKPDFEPVTTPIHSSVSYTYDRMDTLDAVFAGDHDGYVYGRYGNPTVTAFERAMTALEHGASSVAFASGMAAVHGALLGLGLEGGDRLVAAGDLYGASHSLMRDLLARLGIRTRFVDVQNLKAVAEAVGETGPKALFCESISNPLLHVADLEALSEIAHDGGARLIVDNTFATPYLLRPLDHGADCSLHSATKYIGGHGDVMAGVAVCADQKLGQAIDESQRLIGGRLAPRAAWLCLRGLKTLPLRMRQHCQGAQVVADWLAQQAQVGSVNYPGLARHPQHDLLGRLSRGRGYGGMISFTLAGADRDRVFRFMESLKLVLPATSLGDVYSLMLYPYHSSHRLMSPAERKELGIGEDLVRLSVGIEEPGDVIADLRQALAQIL